MKSHRESIRYRCRNIVLVFFFVHDDWANIDIWVSRLVFQNISILPSCVSLTRRVVVSS